MSLVASIVAVVVAVASAVYSYIEGANARERAKKAREEAERKRLEAEDAAKGFQMTVEGQSSPLPVYFGRNLAGGVRVYHNTFNTYNYANPSAASAVSGVSGISDVNGLTLTIPGASYSVGDAISVSIDFKYGRGIGGYWSYDEWGNEFWTPATTLYLDSSINGNFSVTAVHSGNRFTINTGFPYSYTTTYTVNGWFGSKRTETLYWGYNSFSNGSTYLLGAQVFDSGGNMGGSIGGSKHEFLIFQQAICKGRIHKCYTMDFNEEVYNKAEYQYGARIHIYSGGGVADPLMYANDGSRANSKFPGITYATCAFRLNRDEPQYQGVPTVQFYIEGTPVEDILYSNGVYSLGAQSYSNNPVRCLLHYFLNIEYGRGLPLAEIDLESWYNAKMVCETVVLNDVPKEGKLWSAKGGNKQIKRFECNTAIDTSKPVRENIAALLETMDLAELVWSDGKYKLSLVYPTIYSSAATYTERALVQADHNGRKTLLLSKISNNNKPLSDTSAWDDTFVKAITDDDIIRGQDISTLWPDSSTRMNFATVRFLNEAKNFAEDSVSWPSKYGYIAGPNRDRGAWSASVGYIKSDTVTYGGRTYQLKDGSLYSERVSANVPPADSAWQERSNSVYSQYKIQDAHAPLEGDFNESVTTYYHALAEAEHRVRTSRDTVTYKFTLSRATAGIEPGDFIWVNSDVLYIPGELMRIESLKVNKDGDFETVAYKFDAALLAWNANDNEVIAQRNIFDVLLPQVTNLSIDTETKRVLPETIATLKWTSPDDVRVNRYSVKYTLTPVEQLSSSTVWVDLGRTPNTYLEIPYIDDAIVTFCVVAETSSGREAPKFTVDSKWPTLRYDTSLAEFNNIDSVDLSIEQEGIVIRVGKVYTNRALQVEVRKGEWADNILIERSSNDRVVIPFQPVGELKFAVAALSKSGKYSQVYHVNSYVQAPSKVKPSVQVIDNNILFTWKTPTSSQPIDTYEVRKGETFEDADVVGTKTGNFTTVFERTSGTYKYWVVAIDKAGNYGEAGYIITSVRQPADYQFIADFTTTFKTTSNSTISSSNAHINDNLLLPMNLTESYQQHFERMAASTIQDIIEDGFSHWPQSVPTSGFYQEIIDYGTTFASLIHLNIMIDYIRDVAGVDTTITVSTSLDAVTWSDPFTGVDVFISNFRFVKVRIDVVSDGKGFIEIDSIRYVSDVKYKNDAGNAVCSASDGTGTLVTFNEDFFDISSITVTPRGTEPITAIYDFVDAPNPTSFKIYLFNSTTGARVSGEASWAAKGI